MNGIISVFKEAGFTSFDVVAKLRGILHTKKIGHTGTLDPDATGVLPVCVGNATKVCEILSDHDKEYLTEFILGITTDTQDMSGNIISTNSEIPKGDMVEEIVKKYLGEYEQIPPMYSAKKVGGKKLYELARAGISIERKPSKVYIYNIEIINMNLPEVTMKVHCSKGTYIRTLIDDIGKDLGCGAAMKTLVRTRVGEFELKHSLKLSEIEILSKQNRIDSVMMDVRAAFKDMADITLKSEMDKALYNGNKMDLSRYISDMILGQRVGICDSSGAFKAVYECYEINDVESNKEILCKPYRMFL